MLNFQMKLVKRFKAKLPKNFSTKKEAKKFLESMLMQILKCLNLEKKPAKKSPAAPFTTSTLQQEAARKLIFQLAEP